MPDFQQITDCDPAVSLTVPEPATGCLLSVDTADLRFRADGTAPTASIGVLLNSGETAVYLQGKDLMYRAQFFGAGVLNVQYLYS